MYENGILFGQNIELAKKYYAMAGVEKTEFGRYRNGKSIMLRWSQDHGSRFVSEPMVR